MPKDWQEATCDLGVMKTARVFITQQGGALIASQENVLSSNDDIDYVLLSYIEDIETSLVWGKSHVTVDRGNIKRIEYGEAYGFIVEYSSTDEYKGSALMFFNGRNSCSVLLTMMPDEEYEAFEPAILEMFESITYDGNIEEPYIDPSDSSAGEGFVPVISALILAPSNFDYPSRQEVDSHGQSVDPAKKDDVQREVADEPSSNVSEGTYLVGADIKAGTYKLTAQTATSGYWEVKNEVTPDARIIGNEVFDNSTYVTVSDGQYLTLNRCSGVLQNM